MVWRDTQIIAHRGASAYAPENTLPAFEKAAAMGALWTEFDVMLSHDKELFVFHDDTLERTSNGRGRVAEVSAEYLQSLDAGGWFSKQYQQTKIPTFKEVLSWLAQSGVRANIEIKSHSDNIEEVVFAVLKTLNLMWPAHLPRPVISSFDKAIIQYCRQLEPELTLSLLIDTWDEHVIAFAQEHQCISVNLHKKLATIDRIRHIKSHNLLVAAYTVNTRREALKLRARGVDAIFTNYPDIFQLSPWHKLLKKLLDK